jgi:hypothetical protein
MASPSSKSPSTWTPVGEYAPDAMAKLKGTPRQRGPGAGGGGCTACPALTRAGTHAASCTLESGARPARLAGPSTVVASLMQREGEKGTAPGELGRPEPGSSTLLATPGTPAAETPPSSSKAKSTSILSILYTAPTAATEKGAPRQRACGVHVAISFFFLFSSAATSSNFPKSERRNRHGKERLGDAACEQHKRMFNAGLRDPRGWDSFLCSLLMRLCWGNVRTVPRAEGRGRPCSNLCLRLLCTGHSPGVTRHRDPSTRELLPPTMWRSLSEVPRRNMRGVGP